MVDMKKKATDILEYYSNYYSQVDLETLTKFLEQIKSEAIKEFAEELEYFVLNEDIEDMFDKWDRAQYMAGNRGLRKYDGALCTKYFINRSDSKYM